MSKMKQLYLHLVKNLCYFRAFYLEDSYLVR